MSGPPRALVLRQLYLGDFLAGVPALRALRQALPEHHVVLTGPEPLRPLVELSGAVDELLPSAELAPVPWTGPPPDVAVDLHGNGPASKVLLEVLQPARMVAFAGPGGDGSWVDGPAWDPDEHERARWCRLVSHAFGVPADPDELRLNPPEPGPEAGAVVVHPGAASGARRWPPQRFAELARWLSDRGFDVLVTGSAGERRLAEDVAFLAGLPDHACVAGRTDLTGLARIVAHARLVVCGDTGVAHLGSAFGTPSVLLFGPTPPHRWGPPEDGPHDVVWHGRGPGDPHADTPDPALLAITVPEVLRLVEKRLSTPCDDREATLK